MIKAPTKNEKGSALLLIAWLLSIMGVIAIFLIYRTEMEWAAVSALEQRNTMQQLAERQLQECLVLLARDDTPTDSSKDNWFNGNGRVSLERNGYQITLSIEDEVAKPNLNILNAAGLKELVGGSVTAQQVSADPILDWRDINDDLVSDYGAENSYYQGLNPPYKAHNGFFSSLLELKEVRDGTKLYPLIAPEVTVFGRVNPNLLDTEAMRSLLCSIGFDKTRADMVATAFAGKRKIQRFGSLSDFESLNGMDILQLPVLQPYFQFSGSCNLNFISLKGLQAFLSNYGIDPGKADPLVRLRNKTPFTDVNQVGNLLGISTGFTFNGQLLTLSDCFSVVSTLFRIRVWVVKGESKYYLETVQERQPARKGWSVHPLVWKVLLNQEAPDVPSQTETPGISPNPTERNEPSPGP